MTAPTCSCGQGKASAYDGKCGHCRTRRERERHKQLIAAADAMHYGIGIERAVCGQLTTAQTMNREQVTCKACQKALGLRMRSKPDKGGVL